MILVLGDISDTGDHVPKTTKCDNTSNRSDDNPFGDTGIYVPNTTKNISALNWSDKKPLYNSSTV